MKPNQKFLWRLAITTSAEAEDAVTELLAEVAGQPATSFLHAETRRVTVQTHFVKKPKSVPTMLDALRHGLANIRRCGLDPSPAKISSTRIPRESWAHSWKKHFKPLAIGSALLIKPSWIKRQPRPGQASVILDPGLSFGTGQHATTEFCLRQLVATHAANSKLKTKNLKTGSVFNRRDALARGTGEGAAQPRVRAAFPRSGTDSKGDCPNLSLLDIGTGSGILAIAAAKLGFAPIEAFDFDPESVRVATANARKNHVTANIKLSQNDLTRLPKRSAKQFDIVCANLISTLLIAEHPRIIARLKPTILVLAGILAQEFDTVAAVYRRAGLKLVASKRQKEWRSGAFVHLNRP